MACSSAVTGSALAEAVLPALVLAAVICAVLLAVAVVLVVSAAGCSLAVVSVLEAVVSAAVVSPVVDDVVELLDVRRDVASGRLDEPDTVDDAAAVFFDDVDDLPVVLSAADEAVDLGPRAVWPVVFCADPELDVAELDESDAELWSASSALATAMPGPASESPSASAAIPALAPR